MIKINKKLTPNKYFKTKKAMKKWIKVRPNIKLILKRKVKVPPYRHKIYYHKGD